MNPDKRSKLTTEQPPEKALGNDRNCKRLFSGVVFYINERKGKK